MDWKTSSATQTPNTIGLGWKMSSKNKYNFVALSLQLGEEWNTKCTWNSCSWSPVQSPNTLDDSTGKDRQQHRRSRSFPPLELNRLLYSNWIACAPVWARLVRSTPRPSYPPYRKLVRIVDWVRPVGVCPLSPRQIPVNSKGMSPLLECRVGWEAAFSPTPGSACLLLPTWHVLAISRACVR